MNKNKIPMLLLVVLATATAFTFRPNQGANDKAIAFINSLNEIQKTKSLFPFSDMGRYEFTFLPVYMIPRRGIQLKELDSVQKIKLKSPSFFSSVEMIATSQSFTKKLFSYKKSGTRESN